MKILNALTLLIALAASASAQVCENGVCRLNGARATHTGPSMPPYLNQRQPLAQPSGYHGAYRPVANHSRRGLLDAMFAPLTHFSRPVSRTCRDCNCDAAGCVCRQGRATFPAQQNYRGEYHSPRNDGPYFEAAGPVPGRNTLPRLSPSLTTYRPEVRWETNLRTASENARRYRRPMLLVVGADWCGHCQRLKRETLTDLQVTAELRRAFVAVDLNADRNRDLMQQLRIQALPAMLVVDPDLQVVERLEGFRSADQLQNILTRHSGIAQRY